MIKRELQNSICSAILSTTPATSVIVFGSYARGEETPKSDIDLCVITDENKNPFELMTYLRLALDSIIHSPLDIVVYKEADFNEKIRNGYSFETTINKEGVRILG